MVVGAGQGGVYTSRATACVVQLRHHGGRRVEIGRVHQMNVTAGALGGAGSRTRCFTTATSGLVFQRSAQVIPDLIIGAHNGERSPH